MTSRRWPFCALSVLVAFMLASCLPAEPELKVTIKADREIAQEGGEVIYTIVCKNQSNTKGFVQIEVVLRHARNLIFKEASPEPDEPLTNDAREIQWSIPETLGPKKDRSFEAKFKVKTGLPREVYGLVVRAEVKGVPSEFVEHSSTVVTQIEGHPTPIFTPTRTPIPSPTATNTPIPTETLGLTPTATDTPTPSATPITPPSILQLPGLLEFIGQLSRSAATIVAAFIGAIAAIIIAIVRRRSKAPNSDEE